MKVCTIALVLCLSEFASTTVTADMAMAPSEDMKPGILKHRRSLLSTQSEMDTNANTDESIEMGGDSIRDLQGDESPWNDVKLCQASCSDDDVCKFTAKVNLFGGEWGYYQFEECGDVDNPTLVMDVGKTYQFVQSDVSN